MTSAEYFSAHSGVLLVRDSLLISLALECTSVLTQKSLKLSALNVFLLQFIGSVLVLFSVSIIMRLSHSTYYLFAKLSVYIYHFNNLYSYGFLLHFFLIQLVTKLEDDQNSSTCSIFFINF